MSKAAPVPPRGAKTAAPLRDDLQRVVLTTMGSFLLYGFVQIVLSRVVAPFDSSHLVVSPQSATLRWDALHFLGVAQRGYEYEQQLAFQPGWQGLLHLFHRVGGAEGVLEHAASVNVVARVIANVSLFMLTDALHGRQVARLASFLYLLPPAPAVLSAPYTEPLYACLTFAALYLLTRRQYVLASVFFALATSLRSTGIFASVILAITLLAPVLTQRTAVFTTLLKKGTYVAILSAIVAAPFIAFQAYTYFSLCVPEPTRPWCTATLPLSYSYVQKHYWNVGLFRYWRPEQIPNFLLAAPVLAVSVYGAVKAIRQPKNSLDLAINVHSLLMSALLIFASHTQIALRLAPTDVVVWWTLAGALDKSGGSSKLVKYWVWWVCIWGAVSLVLWAGHYPPA